MPYLVNGQPVPEELIREEFARIGRDPQWQTIANPAERADRLRSAAEVCAQDRILIEQAAMSDSRPIEEEVLQQEIERQKAQWGCRAAFDHEELQRLTERNLRIQRIRQEMVAAAPKPSAEQIESFYHANRANFPRPEMFHASHIVKYVNHEQSEQQAEALIEAAMDELEAGEPFADVANRLSDCKDKGGDLGRFPAGQMVEEFEDVIRGLEPGQYSDIFTTPFGFHIALLHEKVPAGRAELEEVRETIERVMLFAAQHEAYLKSMAELRSRAEIRWAPSSAAAAG